MAFSRLVLGNETDTAPDAPLVSGFVADLLEAWFSGKFPDEADPTVVRRNDERVAVSGRFGLEIGDCAERESIDDYVIKYSEPVIHGSVTGPREKSREGVGCATCGRVHCQRTTALTLVLLVRHLTIMPKSPRYRCGSAPA